MYGLTSPLWNGLIESSSAWETTCASYTSPANSYKVKSSRGIRVPSKCNPSQIHKLNQSKCLKAEFVPGTLSMMYAAQRVHWNG